MSDSGSADLSAWIGRSREQEDTVTRRLAESYRVTLAPHLADVDGGLLGLHWCLAPDLVAAAALGRDGHAAKGSLLPPIPLPRRMWAGSEVSFFGAISEGDTIVRRSTVRSIEEKVGRSGPLSFVTVEHAIDNQTGPVVSESHVIVYRDDGPGLSAQAVHPHRETRASHQREIAIDPVLLFRYSALTFNGHRIHYDAPYATEVEGYPGLVIHGPLQATLLLNFAVEIAGRRPRHFSFQSVAPAIGTQRLRLRAREDGEALALEILAADSTLAMRAAARWS